MSWELMSTDKKICPCGKGYIIKEYYMDDWNRSDTKSYFECDYCKEKQLKEQIKTKEMYDACSKIVSYFNNTYLNQLVLYFKSAKNKKAIWKMASDLKLEYRTLSNFYTHNRSLSMLAIDSYVKSLVTVRNIPRLMNILKIKDSTIDMELPDLLDFYEKEERKSYNEAYLRFRKKI